MALAPPGAYRGDTTVERWTTVARWAIADGDASAGGGRTADVRPSIVAKRTEASRKRLMTSPRHSWVDIATCLLEQLSGDPSEPPCCKCWDIRQVSVSVSEPVAAWCTRPTSFEHAPPTRYLRTASVNEQHAY